MTVASFHEVDLLAAPPPAENVLLKDATPCVAYFSVFSVLYYAVRPHDVVGDILVVLSAGILALCIVTSVRLRSVPTVTAAPPLYGV
jgi:threonine dehydrogenase-like Zn-dependent dehydrogenase